MYISHHPLGAPQVPQRYVIRCCGQRALVSHSHTVNMIFPRLVGCPPRTVFLNPPSLPPAQRVRNQPTYSQVEDLPLKRRTHPYTWKYQPAYPFSLDGAPPFPPPSPPRRDDATNTNQPPRRPSLPDSASEARFIFETRFGNRESGSCGSVPGCVEAVHSDRADATSLPTWDPDSGFPAVCHRLTAPGNRTWGSWTDALGTCLRGGTGRESNGHGANCREAHSQTLARALMLGGPTGSPR